MTLSSLSHVLALGAAAVGLLTVGASAQAPLIPANVTHRHTPQRQVNSTSAIPTVVSGPSFVSVPRYGSLATRGPLVPRTGGAVSLSTFAFGWLTAGPDVLHYNSGAVGATYQDASGRVAGIAVDPTDSNTFYSASAGGGVWKTTNGGASYIPLTDFLGDTAMGSVAVAPSDHNTVYAGTGEANFAGDSKYGIGLLKSTNGGTTWSLITGPAGVFNRQSISRIVISPTDPNTVYIATTFAANGISGAAGIWKTADGGATWTNTFASINTFYPFTDLVINPATPTTLYAAIGYIFGSGNNGIYKTINGGGSWTLLGGGLPGGPGRISLALAASNPSIIYASIANTIANGAGLQGLYVTANGGTTWTQKPAAPNYLGKQGWYDNAIVVSPTNPNVVFAGGQVNYNGGYGTLFALAGSQDGGATFQDYSIGSGYTGPHTDLHALTFTADGTELFDGNDGGIWRLENPYSNPGSDGSVDLSTCNWSDLNSNLDTVMFTGIALHPTDPKIAYGGSQDNGTEKTTGSLGWDCIRGGDGGFVRVNQTNPQIVYHEYYGISLEVSSDGGVSWSGGTGGINPNDAVGPDGSDAAAFYVPYKLDPANQSRVIYGTSHVYESLNDAGSFTAIGIPGVAGFNPASVASRTLGVYGSTVYANTGGNIYATFNNGGSWANVSILGYNDSFSDVYVNPMNSKDVFVSRPQFGGGKIFRSTNGGAAWSDITGNLPDEPFNAVLLDKKSGVLYAGGDDGVYSSTNYGGSWSKLSTGLPTVQVTNLDLVNSTGILAAGTHGRGMWTLPLSSVVATPNVIVNAVVTRNSPTTVTVTITLKNTGTSGSPAGTGLADALNTVITSVKLNGVAAAVTPNNVGVVPAYGAVRGLTFTVSNSTSGSNVLRVLGTYGGGKQFGGSLHVAVP